MMRIFQPKLPTLMNARKTYLLATAFFTVLFMALVLAGSWLLAAGSRQFAVAAFLFAFAAVFGQIACLALYIKHKALGARRGQQAEQGGRNRV